MRTLLAQLQHTNVLSNIVERRGRSNGIDALRAVFACWVLMAHLVPWTENVIGKGAVWRPVSFLFDGLLYIFQINGETHPAVVGFIVLSGYCIHRNGLRFDPSGTWPFAIRRCFRILPVYIAATVFGLAVLYAYGNSLYGTPADVDFACLAAKYSFVSVWTPTFYHCEQIDNGPLITVTVEIVLYALYGVFFWLFVWRKNEQWIWLLCVLSWFAALISAAFALKYPNQYVWWQNGSIFGFLPYWWLGAAFLNPSVAATMRRFMIPIILAWLMLTGILMLTGPDAVAGEIRKLLYACCVGALVCRLETLRITPNNPASIVGRGSYSIYAFHGPFAGFLVLIGTPLWLNAIANVGLGMVVYVAIERPFMHLGSVVLKYGRIGIVADKMR